MNWNILLTSGKKIKRDSTISVNENRVAYIYTNNKGKPYFKDTNTYKIHLL